MSREGEATAPAPEQAEAASAVPETPVDAAVLGEVSVALESMQELTAEANATATEAAAAEPEMIEVWRPGRFEERRGQRAHATRPKHRGLHGRRERGPASAALSDAPAPVVQQGELAQSPSVAADAAPATNEHRRFGRRRPERDGDDKRERKRDGRPPRQNRGERSRDDRQRDDRAGGGRNFGKPRREREQADAAPKIYSSRERREKVADPNSPFAKLAALKEQLEAGAKDRH
jgi:ATP-dependent RNA helicase SUPV3L1/SUV3